MLSISSPYFVHRYDPILTLASGPNRKFKFKELYTQYDKQIMLWFLCM